MNNGSAIESEENFNLLEDENFLHSLPNVTESDTMINVVQIRENKKENFILTEKEILFQEELNNTIPSRTNKIKLINSFFVKKRLRKSFQKFQKKNLSHKKVSSELKTKKIRDKFY